MALIVADRFEAIRTRLNVNGDAERWRKEALEHLDRAAQIASIRPKTLHDDLTHGDLAELWSSADAHVQQRMLRIRDGFHSAWARKGMAFS